MAAAVDYPLALVAYPVDTAQYMLFQYAYTPCHIALWQQFAGLQIVFHVLEYPRAAECGTSHHYCVHAIAVETLFGSLRGGNVAVSDNRDMHTRIVLYLPYQRPVCIASVHLAACPPVYRQFGNAAILQRLRQVHYDTVVVVPAETRLDRYGRMHCVHHRAGDTEQLGYVL